MADPLDWDEDRVDPQIVLLACVVVAFAITLIGLFVVAGNVSRVDAKLRECTLPGEPCYQRQREDLVAELIDVQIAVAKCVRESDTAAGIEACVRLDVNP